MSLLPNDWIPRPWEGEEYGIDFEVEIFDCGRATGLLFAVQVKSAKKAGKRPAVSLKWRTWNYWKELQMPVLVVLWDRATLRLWWHWSHQFDTYGLDSGREKFRFRFSPDQVWESSTPARLRSEIDAWRDLDRHAVRFPIEVLLSASGGIPQRVLGAMRRRVESLSDVLTVRTEPRQPVFFTVLTGHSETVILLKGGPTATLHHDDPSWGDDRFVNSWSADVLWAFAQRLDLFGLAPPAARIASVVGREADVIFHPDIAAEVMNLLLRGNRIPDALATFNRLWEGEPSEATIAAMLVIQSAAEVLDEGSRSELVDGCLSLAEGRISRGERIRAAELIYSTSRTLRNADPDRALGLMRQARDLEPAYELRDYWHAELGGLYFLVGDFPSSVVHYERAVALGVRNAVPTLADALMFDGKYEQALTLFAEAVNDERLSKPEWRLKYGVLHFLCSSVGCENQVRQIDKAEALATSGESRDNQLSALEVDLLCASALGRLAQIAKDEGQQSAEWWICLALILQWDAGAWLSALLTTGQELPDLIEDVGLCARRFCGEDIVQLVYAVQGEDSEAAHELGRFFEALPPEPSAPATVRLVQPGSAEYTVITGDSQSGSND